MTRRGAEPANQYVEDAGGRWHRRSHGCHHQYPNISDRHSRATIFLPAAIILGSGIALIIHSLHHETPGASWILSGTKK